MPRVAGGALAALLLTAVARAQKGVGTQEISYRVADLNRCAKTVSGHRCQAWGENDFGLDPNFRRCAKVDGLDKPWCYWGENDEWDYCDEACHRPEGEEQDDDKCRRTTAGNKCEAWGENDFGLDPDSKECAKVDGLDKPWCYWGDNDEWDYCDESCDKAAQQKEEKEPEKKPAQKTKRAAEKKPLEPKSPRPSPRRPSEPKTQAEKRAAETKTAKEETAAPRPKSRPEASREIPR